MKRLFELIPAHINCAGGLICALLSRFKLKGFLIRFIHIIPDLLQHRRSCSNQIGTGILEYDAHHPVLYRFHLAAGQRNPRRAAQLSGNPVPFAAHQIQIVQLRLRKNNFLLFLRLCALRRILCRYRNRCGRIGNRCAFLDPFFQLFQSCLLYTSLFAAYHVFLRLLVPRHPPYALTCLTFTLTR